MTVTLNDGAVWVFSRHCCDVVLQNNEKSIASYHFITGIIALQTNTGLSVVSFPRFLVILGLADKKRGGGKIICAGLVEIEIRFWADFLMLEFLI